MPQGNKANHTNYLQIMKYITKVCGHSSTKITEQVYAKLLNETVVDAVQEISNKLE